jgi:hypothetical protein
MQGKVLTTNLKKGKQQRLFLPIYLKRYAGMDRPMGFLLYFDSHCILACQSFAHLPQTICWIRQNPGPNEEAFAWLVWNHANEEMDGDQHYS